MGIQNAHALYLKYSTDTQKLPLLWFQYKVAEYLIYYNEDDWPKNDSLRIPHAQPLAPEVRHKSPRKAPSRTATTAPPIPASPADAILQCDRAIPVASTSTSVPLQDVPTPMEFTEKESIPVASTSTTVQPQEVNVPIASTSTSVQQNNVSQSGPRGRGRGRGRGRERGRGRGRAAQRIIIDHNLRLSGTWRDHRVIRNKPRGKCGRRCVVCSLRDERHESNFMCSSCKHPLCTGLKNNRDCYIDFHTLRHLC